MVGPENKNGQKPPVVPKKPETLKGTLKEVETGEVHHPLSRLHERPKAPGRAPDNPRLVLQSNMSTLADTPSPSPSPLDEDSIATQTPAKAAGGPPPPPPPPPPMFEAPDPLKALKEKMSTKDLAEAKPGDQKPVLGNRGATADLNDAIRKGKFADRFAAVAAEQAAEAERERAEARKKTVEMPNKQNSGKDTAVPLSANTVSAGGPPPPPPPPPPPLPIISIGQTNNQGGGFSGAIAAAKLKSKDTAADLPAAAEEGQRKETSAPATRMPQASFDPLEIGKVQLKARANDKTESSKPPKEPSELDRKLAAKKAAAEGLTTKANSEYSAASSLVRTPSTGSSNSVSSQGSEVSTSSMHSADSSNSMKENATPQLTLKPALREAAALGQTVKAADKKTDKSAAGMSEELAAKLAKRKEISKD